MERETIAAKAIAAAGGDSEFARLLGIDTEPGYQQRVNNWKRRGIPPGVVLEHYDILKKLTASLPGKPSVDAVASS